MDLQLRSHARRLIGGAALVVIAGLFSAGNSWSQAPKELTFATDPTYAPFEFTKDGKLTGFDIELVEAMAAAGKFEIKFENVPFDGMIPALKAGNYDAAIAAMVATEERAKSVAFSSSYFKTGLVIIVRSDETKISGEKDLAGKKIAVEIGSVGAEKARTFPDAVVSTFNGSPATMLELANGNVDAVIGDGASAKFALETGAVKGIKILPDLLSSDFYAIALPKGSKNVGFINDTLKKVVDNGDYARIYKKWFGEAPPRT